MTCAAWLIIGAFPNNSSPSFLLVSWFSPLSFVLPSATICKRPMLPPSAPLRFRPMFESSSNRSGVVHGQDHAKTRFTRHHLRVGLCSLFEWNIFDHVINATQYA